MKYVAALLALGIVGFSQDAAVKSDQSTQSLPSNTARRGDRVFFFKDGAGNVSTRTTTPSQLGPSLPKHLDRIFYFMDGAGHVTGDAIMPFQSKPDMPNRTDLVSRKATTLFQLTPYQLRNKDRLFFFKDGAPSSPENGATGGTIDKDSHP